MSFLVALAVIVACVLLYGQWSTPHPYGQRACAGKLWKRAFPRATKAEIRTFLQCFVEAMRFPSKDKLKFGPDDQVLTVYRAIYGGKTPIADSCECEGFVLTLRDDFAIPASEILERWREDLTLGELFSVVTRYMGRT